MAQEITAEMIAEMTAEARGWEMARLGRDIFAAEIAAEEAREAQERARRLGWEAAAAGEIATAGRFAIVAQGWEATGRRLGSFIDRSRAEYALLLRAAEAARIAEMTAAA